MSYDGRCCCFGVRRVSVLVRWRFVFDLCCLVFVVVAVLLVLLVLPLSLLQLLVLVLCISSTFVVVCDALLCVAWLLRLRCLFFLRRLLLFGVCRMSVVIVDWYLAFTF